MKLENGKQGAQIDVKLRLNFHVLSLKNNDQIVSNKCLSLQIIFKNIYKTNNRHWKMYENIKECEQINIPNIEKWYAVETVIEVILPI